MWLSNLGGAYSGLGETRRAIQFYEQSLAINRTVGSRTAEGDNLINLAEISVDADNFYNTLKYASEVLKLGDEISSPAHVNYGNLCVSLAQLFSGNLSASRAAAENSRKYDVTAVQEAFTAAIQHADKILELTPDFFEALDAKGVALCGLALCNVAGGRGEAFDNVSLNDKTPSIAPNN